MKLSQKEWKNYYPMINAMVRGKINSPLIIVTENLKDIPDKIINHSILIDNIQEEQETFPLENEPQ